MSLKKRIGHLLCYRESVERWPFYQHFPPMLVLVSEPRRMQHWQWCARETAAALNYEPLSGAIACIPHEPGSQPYNPWQLNWQTLGTNVQCVPQLLLQPLPIEAIPPNVWDQQATHSLNIREEFPGDRHEIAMPSSARKRKRIIVGSYMVRAITAQKKLFGDVSSESERIAMLGLCLGQRHCILLRLLFQHPFLHVHDIATELELEEASIRRYLSDLYAAGCIESADTDAGHHWRLSEQGLRLLAAMQHISLPGITKQQDRNTGAKLVQHGVDLLYRNLEHTAGIYSFFTALSKAASEERSRGQKHRLLRWETGPVCERRYRNHEQWHNFPPDAIAAYEAGGRRVCFWLEWDRGTMGTRVLMTKLSTYMHYAASREWFKQETAIPLLLVVTADPGQERRFARVATVIRTDTCGLDIRTTTLTRANEHGYLGPIWNQLLSNSSDTNRVARSKFYL